MSWSKKYYKTLSELEHKRNDEWFKNTLSLLKEDGILYVPSIDKTFNKEGVEL
tara:strand:+ start:3291 stop:3449 length:159 start_codon:yes stop_codon:yes gene_type:complete